MKFYFDMDGTIANFYGVKNWLNKIENEDITPYIEAEPLINPDELKAACKALAEQGHKFGIITWGAKNARPEYDKAVEAAKKEWLGEYFPWLLADFNYQCYGVKKQKVVARNCKACLIDDNAEIRAIWKTKKRRITIDANTDIIKALKAFIA